MAQDWKNSPAHLLLLSKFLHGRRRDHYTGDERWTEVLGEPAVVAVERFLQENWLGPVGLTFRLDARYQATQLKAMLKERGLKVSGRKSELIERLIEADRQGMDAATRGVDTIICSATAIHIAEKFVARQQSDRANAERETHEALRVRHYIKAVRIMAAYEAAQVFPRGLGVDWRNYDHERAAEMLRLIFEKTPRILGTMEPARIDALRPPAAMMQLWSASSAAPWLPDGYNTETHLDSDSAARMLVSYAMHLQRIAACRESGTTEVKVSGIADGRQCGACKTIDGKRYVIDEVPEFPYPNCTCDSGCRCFIVSVVVHGVDFEKTCD